MSKNHSISTAYRLPICNPKISQTDIDHAKETSEVIKSYMSALEHRNQIGTITPNQKIKLNYMKNNDILGWTKSLAAKNTYAKTVADNL